MKILDNFKNLFSSQKGNLPEKNGSLFIITGMHRSGTSALSRICNIAGFELGDNLIPPAAGDNDLGFWEDSFAVNLNESLLESFESAHLSLKELPEDFEIYEKSKTYLDNAKNFLNSFTANKKLPAIKDPRFSRVLPLWLLATKELGISSKIIISVRNPYEVAMSLNKRNGISIEHGIALWMQYNFKAEEHSRNLQRVIVSYNQTMSDCFSVLNLISTKLGLEFNLADNSIKDEIKNFIRPELYRNQSSNDWLPELVKSLYIELLKDDPSIEKIDSIKREYVYLSAPFQC